MPTLCLFQYGSHSRRAPCTRSHIPERQTNFRPSILRIPKDAIALILVGVRKRSLTGRYQHDMDSTTLYCTVLYCTVLYCTVLYCTVLYFLRACLSCYSIINRPPNSTDNGGGRVTFSTPSTLHDSLLLILRDVFPSPVRWRVSLLCYFVLFLGGLRKHDRSLKRAFPVVYFRAPPTATGPARRTVVIKGQV